MTPPTKIGYGEVCGGGGGRVYKTGGGVRYIFTLTLKSGGGWKSLGSNDYFVLTLWQLDLDLYDNVCVGKSEGGPRVPLENITFLIKE